MGQLEVKRLEFDAILKGIMQTHGLDPNVYFQPPESLQISYPCIVYKRRYITRIHADNNPYLLEDQYTVTYIDRRPNSDVIDSLIGLRYSRYISSSVVDGLNHDAFEIYY